MTCIVNLPWHPGIENVFIGPWPEDDEYRHNWAEHPWWMHYYNLKRYGP